MFLSCFHFFSNYCFVLLLLLLLLKWLFVCLFSAHFYFFSESEQCVVSFFSLSFFCFTLLSSVSKAASRFYSTLLPGRFFVIVGGGFCTSLKRRQKCRLHERKRAYSATRLRSSRSCVPPQARVCVFPGMFLFFFLFSFSFSLWQKSDSHRDSTLTPTVF